VGGTLVAVGAGVGVAQAAITRDAATSNDSSGNTFFRMVFLLLKGD
jgi:hypothetical protein